MHGIELFTQLSILMVIAAVVALLARKLRQPLILSYIISGLLVGTLLPLMLRLLDRPQIDTGVFEIFSSLGIAFLLFIIGTELSVSVFKRLGSVVVVTALAILGIVGGIGFVIAYALDFTTIEAVVTGLALFFSSTIIIVKVLSDKKESTRLHGQIAIGVIIFDDIVATLALLYIAAGRDGFDASTLGLLAIKGVILGTVLAVAAIKVLPRLTRVFASSQELLFLFTIAWGLGIASLFQALGFSIEIGALFAGVSLASLPYTQEMASRLKPLRDFFIVIFFITLGAGLHLDHLSATLVPALILSAIVLVAKPLIVMAVLNLFHYTKRTAFKAGVNLSQISEFSIILVAVAATYGVASDSLTAMITLIALITIAVSTYLMNYDNKIFLYLEKHFSFFRDQSNRQDEALEQHSLFLFGYRRGGGEFVNAFKSMNKKYLVVDYDPDVIETLEHRNIPYMYGDATDIELLGEIGIKHASLIVSAITNFNTTEQLLRYAKHVNPTVTFICNADDWEESAELYRLGASFVMLPHHTGSERISRYLREHGATKTALRDYRRKHMFQLGRTALKEK